MQFKAASAGTYTIAIDHVDGLFTGEQSIYVKDDFTGIAHNLKSGGYNFASEAGTFDRRFKLVYTAALSVTNPVLTENAVIIYKNDNQDFVINSGNSTMESINIFDTRGRLLLSKNNIGASEIVLTAGQSNEVLLVRITSNDGTIVTKKVVRY